jgi:hypothetical protein
LGKVFGTDPIALLDVDDVEWVLRIACANVISADNERERKELEQRRQ